jgi:hypothetical protein
MPFPISGDKRKKWCALEINSMMFSNFFKRANWLKYLMTKRLKKKKDSEKKKENPEGLYTI